jgi:hypothetical protein
MAEIERCDRVEVPTALRAVVGAGRGGFWLIDVFS